MRGYCVWLLDDSRKVIYCKWGEVIKSGCLKLACHAICDVSRIVLPDVHGNNG